jgi:hypothetical protein
LCKSADYVEEGGADTGYKFGQGILMQTVVNGVFDGSGVRQNLAEWGLKDPRLDARKERKGGAVGVGLQGLGRDV